ncbi:hypothetical protein PJM33_29500, partial [Mycobacterium kansasii]
KETDLDINAGFLGETTPVRAFTDDESRLTEIQMMNEQELVYTKKQKKKTARDKMDIYLYLLIFLDQVYLDLHL